MYYSASDSLTEGSPHHRPLIESLDREIAHAYHPSGRGHLEHALLRSLTRADSDVLEQLLSSYRGAGVVQSLEQWTCPDGNRNDPEDALCPHCGVASSDGEPGDQIIRVIRQPQWPAFNANQQPANPEVFVSYRRADAGILASDIYYLLQSRGIRTFLDVSDIAPGEDPPREYLEAASAAPYFIALVSQTYFESAACRLEIAHAARARNRILRINVPQVPVTPADLIWVDQPNWVAQQGTPSGLSAELAEAVYNAVRTTEGRAIDLRRDACRYLMERRSRNALLALVRRLPWMREFDFTGTPNSGSIIDAIHRETSDDDVPTLCAVLRPS